MLLQPVANDQSKKNKIVKRRTSRSKRPLVTHVLNSITRGTADDSSPHFAAAALFLHVPFRSISHLLHGCTLTDRLKQLLESSAYDHLNSYVTRSHQITVARSRPATADPDESTFEQAKGGDSESDGQLDENYNDSDSEEMEQRNPLIGLSAALAALGNSNPMTVTKEWFNTFPHAQRCSMQSDRFREYVSTCKRFGLTRANKTVLDRLGSSGPIHDDPADDDHYFKLDQKFVFETQRAILSSCRTEEQRKWLQSVISYLQIYYRDPSSDVSPELVDIMRPNHPFLTSAPGGGGKSWLVERLSEFITRCIPPNATPAWSRLRATESSSEASFFVSDKDFPVGRLGRTAIMAPSGVEAGNCNGFTIHNALHISKLTDAAINEGPSPETLGKFIHDFSRVVCVVVDEVSMTALKLLKYLDLVMRRVRPAFAHIFFDGIPVILTGDAYQLPVVNAVGILSDPNRIPEYLRSMHEHCTCNVFAMKLSKSIRQCGDNRNANALLRMRLA